MLRRFVTARRRAVILLLALLLALAATLTACRKPAPRITVYAAHKSIQVSAAFYIQTGGPKRNFLTDFANAPTITVPPDTKLLVDVPRAVSLSWVVVAVTVSSTGASTPVPNVAPAEVLRNRHTVTLAAAPASTGDYYVQVAQLRGSVQAGGWIFHVKPTG